MFSFFKKKSTSCPVDEQTRIWIENSILWLTKQFGEKKILELTTLLPIPEHFPVQFDGTEQVAHAVACVVAKQMDIKPDSINLSFYSQKLFEIQSDTGQTLLGQQFDNEKYSSGLYQGRSEDGKYSVSVETGQLQSPDKLVATLAHEFAHIKILGEGRLTENDEYLTDLVTVFFGLGIFNANAAARFYSGFDRWGYSKQGYLTQQEWGYALAIYAYIRNESNPSWIKYLTTNIKSDYKKSEAYIYENQDKVLV